MKPSDLYNPIMKWLLRSSLHSLVSGNTLLLVFTGRKSGQEYSTPINYAREGDCLTLITSRQHEWWKNLQTARPVKLQLRGHEVCGIAQVLAPDAETMVAAMEKVYHGIPHEQAVKLAPESLIIRIVLN